MEPIAIGGSVSTAGPLRTIRSLACIVVVSAVVLSGGCSSASLGSNSEEPKSAPPESSEGANEATDSTASAYLSGDDPLLVAREQLAQDSGMLIEDLVARIAASSVDGEQVWLRVTVENPSAPGAETESVYLVSENEGPWQIVVYGTGVEMGDLAAYGASPEIERALFYWVSANEAVYDYLDKAENGRYGLAHTVRQRFLDLGDAGFWALVDLAEYSSEERVVVMAVLEWDLETGDWTVVAHGQSAYAVSDEPPEQLLSGPWTNEILY